MSVGSALKTAPKNLVQTVLKRCGVYLARYPRFNTLDAHLVYLFSVLGINCVLDVGAHRGEYGLELRRSGYRGFIISFEPVTENFVALERRAAGDPRWR